MENSEELAELTQSAQELFPATIPVMLDLATGDGEQGSPNISNDEVPNPTVLMLEEKRTPSICKKGLTPASSLRTTPDGMWTNNGKEKKEARWSLKSVCDEAKGAYQSVKCPRMGWHLSLKTGNHVTTGGT